MQRMSFMFRLWHRKFLHSTALTFRLLGKMRLN